MTVDGGTIRAACCRALVLHVLVNYKKLNAKGKERAAVGKKVKIREPSFITHWGRLWGKGKERRKPAAYFAEVGRNLISKQEKKEEKMRKVKKKRV